MGSAWRSPGKTRGHLAVHFLFCSILVISLFYLIRFLNHTTLGAFAQEKEFSPPDLRYILSTTMLFAVWIGTVCEIMRDAKKPLVAMILDLLVLIPIYFLNKDNVWYVVYAGSVIMTAQTAIVGKHASYTDLFKGMVPKTSHFYFLCMLIAMFLAYENTKDLGQFVVRLPSNLIKVLSGAMLFRFAQAYAMSFMLGDSVVQNKMVHVIHVKRSVMGVVLGLSCAMSGLWVIVLVQRNLPLPVMPLDINRNSAYYFSFVNLLLGLLMMVGSSMALARKPSGYILTFWSGIALLGVSIVQNAVSLMKCFSSSVCSEAASADRPTFVSVIVGVILSCLAWALVIYLFRPSIRPGIPRKQDDLSSKSPSSNEPTSAAQSSSHWTPGRLDGVTAKGEKASPK